MDTLSANDRSRLMGRVRQRHTMPELVVRRILHGMGCRFSLHKKELPGTPDIFLRKHHKAIQVFGCFWHGHDCKKGRLPKSRTSFWREKINKNRIRDARTLNELSALGIDVLVIWECDTKDGELIYRQLWEFMHLEPRSTKIEGGHD